MVVGYRGRTNAFEVVSPGEMLSSSCWELGKILEYAAPLRVRSVRGMTRAAWIAIAIRAVRVSCSSCTVCFERTSGTHATLPAGGSSRVFVFGCFLVVFPAS